MTSLIALVDHTAFAQPKHTQLQAQLDEKACKKDVCMIWDKTNERCQPDPKQSRNPGCAGRTVS